MTSTSTLDRPTGDIVGSARHQAPPVVYTGLLLGHPVVVEADQPLPVTATDLLDQLNTQWDVRQRHSDFDRINNYPNVVISVSQPTCLLLDNALAAIHLARVAGLQPGPCQAILDHRRGRIGADPDVAAVMARLAPATAADLLADICLAAGISTGSIRVGTAVHVLGHPIEAWLSQTTSDITLHRRLHGEIGMATPAEGRLVAEVRR
ncbi:MAG: hypothetical protein QOG60_2547 [Frankiaceae bacterium]|jgi:hypothetical protein|nr:hypothetical protein [Frankiaceae bacterium]